jgi:HEPN domain-containing protein
MLPVKRLRELARSRLLDAEVLFAAKRFDGAFYLCGYAVELALKARICRTLKWNGFPETGQEFHGLQSVKTHDLTVLLKFSGLEGRVKTTFMPEWSNVQEWNPERRYQPSALTSRNDAEDMLTSARKLLVVL